MTNEEVWGMGSTEEIEHIEICKTTRAKWKGNRRLLNTIIWFAFLAKIQFKPVISQRLHVDKFVIH